MSRRLRVLFVEDSAADAELVLHELLQGGYEIAAERVQTADEMREKLKRDTWDLVISDFSMPGFSAPAALTILQETQQHIPFIIVSGTIGEEAAVTSLKAGASDFLPKGNLSRFLPAVERELRDARLRRERETLEAQLRQAQQLEAIGRLAGGIAHDFNNILSAILGYSEMVLEQIGPDKPISRDLQEISDAANRAAGLTRQLLAFSHKQAMHVRPLDLNEVVRGVRAMLQRLIREDIDLRVDLADALPPIVGDRLQLEQVLMNLVTNARDAMPDGGILTIATGIASAETEGDVERVTLSVTDTGAGMDADTQAHIFEPFFTTKPVGKGTGLGLATVYGVVQQLRGSINISSHVGKGTAFQLSFPGSSDATVAAAGPVRSVVPQIPEGKYVVLVVDDEDGVRKILSRILTRHGYEVLQASRPSAAIEIAQQFPGPIHLVVSDVVMPEMYGPKMVDALRTTRRDLGVLYVSGYVDESISSRGLGENATVLAKPFSASELLEAVRSALMEQGSNISLF